MSQDIDVRRDPRFDAIIAKVQVNREACMLPSEIFATALADAYIIGTEDGKQERDELRAQLATTYMALLDVYETWAESGSVVEPMLRAKALLDKTPIDAAQYVRGLEAAITEAIDKAEWANDNDLIVQQLRHALAAKEDRR